ncbi:MAG: NAD-dependent epimerase/dehydratase family protein [Myxococcota bacterium]|nr:NAD-dependent epimerase/dehydratase family protein [Myxococcota bacterium]
MNLLITGISGQMGQAMVGRLFVNNPFTRVVGVDRVPPSVLGPAHYVETDLRTVDMGDLLATNEIDVVIHCAMGDGFADEKAMISTLEVVTEAVRQTEVTRLVVPSRDWVYDTSDIAASETDFTAGIAAEDQPRISKGKSMTRRHHPGVQSARAVELMLAQMAETPGMPSIVIPRFGTMIGPHRTDTFNAILKHRFLLTSPIARQCYQVLHIEDAAQFLLACATQPNLNGAYNIASDEILSLETIAGILEKKLVVLPVWALKVYVSVFARSGALEFSYRDLVRVQLGAPMNTQRMQTVLGRPRLTSRQALALWRAQGHGEPS